MIERWYLLDRLLALYSNFLSFIYFKPIEGAPADLKQIRSILMNLVVSPSETHKYLISDLFGNLIGQPCEEYVQNFSSTNHLLHTFMFFWIYWCILTILYFHISFA